MIQAILVTGASGFLGQELTSLLRSSGIFRIITTDLRGDSDYIGDLSDPNFVRLLPKVNIVINCAAVQYVSKSLPLFFRKHYFKKNNVSAMENLLQHYGDALDHFIHIGTSMMYEQDGSIMYGVDSRLTGQGLYSESKLAQQLVLEKFSCIKSTVVPCIIGAQDQEDYL